MAFGLIIGIVAAPLVPWMWPPPAGLVENRAPSAMPQNGTVPPVDALTMKSSEERPRAAYRSHSREKQRAVHQSLGWGTSAPSRSEMNVGSPQA